MWALIGLLACGDGVVRVPAPPMPCFATTALPIPADCDPAGRPSPASANDLTCTYKEGGDRCAGLASCWWVGARMPAATGRVTCRQGSCTTEVEVVAGATPPDGARGEWARMANKGEPAGFHACDTPFPGTPLR
ncbi:MAG: hypothetical protein ACI8PZ_006431 [Myxococcota bacterium]|jgi:hypothetical protein